jgi:hypothetical protein
MADVVDELLSRKPATVKPSVDVIDELIGPRTGRLLKREPEALVRSAAGAASPLTALQAGVPTQQEAAIEVFARARGIPKERYMVYQGDIFYQGDDGKFYAEVPGVMKAPLTSAAFVAPDIAEALPSVATGVATAPMMLTGPGGAAASMGLTGLVGGASSAARQGVAGLLSSQEFSPAQAAGAGLMEFATQGVPYGAARIAQRSIARDIAKLDPQQVADLQRLAQQQGIQLTPAELTGLPSLRAQQKMLGNIPGAQDVLGQFYGKRYEQQIQPAVDNFLSSISRLDDPMTAGYRGQTALKDRLEQLRQQREQAAKPLYEQAFQNAPAIDIEPIAKRIDSMLQIAKGEEARELASIRKMLTREKTGLDANGNQITITTLEDRPSALQRVKFDLDRRLNDPAVTAMDATIRSELTGVQNQLVNTMESAIPEYKLANQEFARLSEPINRFMERRPGLSLINMSQDNLDQFAERVFGSASNPASPQSIRYTKQQIEQSGPNGDVIWNEVTRAYLERVWQKSMKPVATATEKKVDAGLSFSNILMGDEKQRKALQAALSPQQYVALTDLTKVLEAAGRVKKLGSDTAFNNLVLEDMKETTPGLLVKALTPVKSLQDYFKREAFEKNADVLADIITSPDGMRNLRQLRQVNPQQPKFWSLLAQSLASAGAYGIQEVLE